VVEKRGRIGTPSARYTNGRKGTATVPALRARTEGSLLHGSTETTRYDRNQKGTHKANENLSRRKKANGGIKQGSIGPLRKKAPKAKAGQMLARKKNKPRLKDCINGQGKEGKGVCLPAVKGLQRCSLLRSPNSLGEGKKDVFGWPWGEIGIGGGDTDF